MVQEQLARHEVKGEVVQCPRHEEESTEFIIFHYVTLHGMSNRGKKREEGVAHSG
jgi:hypothetical protein